MRNEFSDNHVDFRIADYRAADARSGSGDRLKCDRPIWCVKRGH
jgi:hypothetical protein